MTMGWPPTTTRSTRHGDLLAVADAVSDQQERQKQKAEG